MKLRMNKFMSSKDQTWMLEKSRRISKLAKVFEMRLMVKIYKHMNMKKKLLKFRIMGSGMNQKW